jgi:hypothetical protein
MTPRPSPVIKLNRRVLYATVDRLTIGHAADSESHRALLIALLTADERAK